jgi:hypothetical protein
VFSRSHRSDAILGIQGTVAVGQVFRRQIRLP